MLVFIGKKEWRHFVATIAELTAAETALTDAINNNLVPAVNAAVAALQAGASIPQAAVDAVTTAATSVQSAASQLQAATPPPA